MGFFRKLFGRGNGAGAGPTTASAARLQPGPATGIRYDAELIPALLDDHAQLGDLFARIGQAHEARDFAAVRELLGTFKSRLQAHVLVENVRFYNYVEQSLAGDETNAQLMRSFRRDMNTIVRQVLEFVRKYEEASSAAAFAGFEADYSAVGALLERRLDSEESQLYPLYRKV